MAKKTPLEERKDRERKFAEKVNSNVVKLGKALSAYGKFSEKEIRRFVYKKEVEKLACKSDSVILLGLYFQENEEACRQVAEIISGIMNGYYSSKTYYPSEARGVYAIQVGNDYYRGDGNKTCDMQKACIKAIVPIVEEVIAPVVKDIKDDDCSARGLYDGVKLGFSVEDSARTYEGPKLIKFTNNQDFAESTVRGALRYAVQNLKNKQSNGEDTSAH